MPSAPCSVNDCYKSFQSKHCFPNPSKDRIRFNKWVSLCGNRRLVVEMTPEKVYKNCRVCSLHFLPKDFGPNNILKRDALPSHNLPAPLEGNAEEVSPSKTIIPTVVSTTADSPRSLRLKRRLESLLEKQRAKKQVIDNTMPSTSTSSIYEFKSLPATSATDDTTNETRKLPSLSAQILGTPSTSEKRSILLSEVNVTQMKDLTPKAKHLYRRAIQFKKKAILSKKSTLSLRKRLYTRETLTKSKMFEKCVSSMDCIRKRFFQCQLENAGKKPKGRRYTLEDKVLALALYKQSGTAYRFLSKLFALPSRKTVMKLLNRIPIKPGLHEEVFAVLKSEVKNFKHPLDKHCLLMFDEMSIQPSLQPKINEGRVVGFEDFGFRQTENIANHTQVFMLRGIRRKWKQPVYYNFVNGATKKEDLARILKLIIRKCHSIGLNIVATVCDQGTNNQGALKILAQQTEEKYAREGRQFHGFNFEIDDKKIIILYDVPHLFKGLRNNLLKYHATYVEEGITKTAKWEDIYIAYQMDPYLGSLRLMPKITDAHVNPNKINKMKVSNCMQVFSHSVAAAINVFAFSGTTVTMDDMTLKLEKSAADTANLLDFFDALFDSLNGSAFQNTTGKSLRIAVTQGSAHVKFWQEAMIKLRTIGYVRNNNSFIPPSVKNLMKTIENFQELWLILKNLGFKYLMPRTFNQDPLENFFGQIRQRGQRNINPTAADFNNYYKSLLVNRLTSFHSVGANCEEDNSEVFLTLQRLVSQGLPEEEEEIEAKFSQVPDNIHGVLKPIETQALRYVCGYLFKKIGKQPCNCKRSFLKSSEAESEESELFISQKEYTITKKSLNYVSPQFLDKLRLVLSVIKFIFNRDLHKKNLYAFTLKTLMTKFSFTECFHDEQIKMRIFKYLITLKLFNYTTQINRIMKGLDQRPIPIRAPKFFISAKKMYKTIKHKK